MVRWTGRPGVARLQLGRTPAKIAWYCWKLGSLGLKRPYLLRMSLPLRVCFYRCFRAVFYLYPFLVLWHSLVSVALSLSTGFVSLVNSESVRVREWEAGSAIFSKRVHWQWEQCRFRSSSCLREGRVRSRTPWFWCSCVRCQKHFSIGARRFRCTEVPFQPNTYVLSGRHVVTVGAKCLRCTEV